MMKGRSASTLILLASLLTALMGLVRIPSAHAASTSTGTLNGTFVTVNNGPGEQTDPHVSGSLVSYTDNSTGGYEVRYHNLDKADDAVIPTNGGQDLLSGISDTTVVYMHSTANGQSIYRYDIGSGNAPVELDPQPGTIRESPAIGNRTAAWVDYTADPAHPQIVAYNLDTGVATTLTSDTTMQNLEPAVSPDDSVIVWAKCSGSFSGCNVWEAVFSGGKWSANQLTSDNASELPHTNGQVVIYDSTRNGEQDIYWQPVGGGTEQQLSFAGPDRNPHISGNLIAFDHFDTTASIPNWDDYVYSLANQTLYRVTNTLTDETLSDISVTSDGTARVIWNTLESDYNVYGFIFQAPAALTANVTNVGATEGSLFSSTVATGTYSGAGTLSASIKWGDGSSSPGSVSLNVDGSYSVTGSHTYGEEGSFDLTVQVSESGGQSAAADGKAAVVDAPLTITRLVVGTTGKGLAGLAATFTDADPAGRVSDYSATISWGDGATSTGLIATYHEDAWWNEELPGWSGAEAPSSQGTKRSQIAGQIATACSDLTDFINQVKAKTSKGICPSQATTLIKAATNIRMCWADRRAVAC
jgi:hypothetical protein